MECSSSSRWARSHGFALYDQLFDTTDACRRTRKGRGAAAAGAAALVVAAIGALVAKQPSQVPENTVKLAVGIMLTSSGLFWVAKFILRAVRAFGLFWCDFLVGDTPELLTAVIAIVALALLLRHHHDAAIIFLPVTTVLFLNASTFRGRRRDGTRPHS